MNEPSSQNRVESQGYVLVVEDSDVMRVEMVNILSRAGFTCQGVASGEDTIARVISGDPPELLVLDYVLPDMTAAEIIAELDKKDARVPFIVTTGQGDELVAVEMMKAGASDYLAKGRSLRELLPKVVQRVRDGVLVGRRLVELEVERRQLQHEIDKVRDLEREAEELRANTAQLVHTEKLVALGELSACVAHELNQPLNAAKLAVQSILRDPSDVSSEEVIAELKDVLGLFATMGEIVDHMRVFSRSADTGAWSPVNVNNVLTRAVRFVRQELALAGINLVMELGSDLPELCLDPTQIEQVVLNLLLNARDALIDHGREDRTIGVTSAVAPSDEEQAPAMVTIRVWDNGPGVAEEAKEDLFFPFFTTKEPGRGTGLGLAVASHIIAQHHGTLTLLESGNEGSVFEIALPTELPENSQSSAPGARL